MDITAFACGSYCNDDKGSQVNGYLRTAGSFWMFHAIVLRDWKGSVNTMKIITETPLNALQTIYDSTVDITAIHSVQGGDINEAYLLELSDGSSVFMKKHEGTDPEFFQVEADGLNAIRRTKTISVPEVILAGTDPSCGKVYLLMQYVCSAARKPDFWERFGRELAEMHIASTEDMLTGGRYGFPSDNYIGATRQINKPAESWIRFYRDRRLEYQYRKVYHFLDQSDRKAMQYILDHLDQWLMEPAYPSLLHGDLWGGNFIVGHDGYAWLIDPAVYVGNREADLAMTELFGGFSRTFYDAYQETSPLEAGYEDRRDLYHLYHLLNHLNLFGTGYLSSVRQILHRYAGR